MYSLSSVLEWIHHKMRIHRSWLAALAIAIGDDEEESKLVSYIPLSLMLGEDLPLGVVADDLDVDEASEVELIGPEHGHICWSSVVCAWGLRSCTAVCRGGIMFPFPALAFPLMALATVVQNVPTTTTISQNAMTTPGQERIISLKDIPFIY